MVRIARLWRCIPEDAEHSVGDLRGIFRSHIFHPVRMVSGVPTRFVEQRHYLHRQAAGEVAGRAHPPSYRRYRYATRSRSNRRRHVGGEWPTFALYWYAPRATAEFVPAPRLAADYGVATGAGGYSCGIAIFIILTTGSFQVFAGRVHGLQ